MFVRNVSTDGTAVCQPDKQSTLYSVSKLNKNLSITPLPVNPSALIIC